MLVRVAESIGASACVGAARARLVMAAVLLLVTAISLVHGARRWGLLDSRPLVPISTATSIPERDAQKDLPSDLIVVVEADSTEAVRRTIDRLEQRLAARPERFRNTLGRIDPSGLRSKSLQYLSPAVLESLVGMWDEVQPGVTGWHRFELLPIVERTTRALSGARSKGSPEAKALLEQCRKLSLGLVQASVDGLEESAFASPWPSLGESLPPQMETLFRPRYLLSDDGRAGFVLTEPVADDGDPDGYDIAIGELRRIAAEVEREQGDGAIQIGVTGLPVTASDSRRDGRETVARLTGLLMLVIPILLLLWNRSVRQTWAVLLGVGVVFLMTFGVAELVWGTVRLIDGVVPLVLIPACVVFCTVWLAEFRVASRAPGGEQGLVAESLRRSVGRIVTMAVLAVAPLAMRLALGGIETSESWVTLIGGVVLSSVAALFVLPAWISLSAAAAMPSPPSLREQFGLQRPSRLPKVMLWLTSLVVLIGGANVASHWMAVAGVDRASLLRIGPPEESSAAELLDRIGRISTHSPVAAYVECASVRDALRMAERVRELPGVAAVEELALLTPAFPSDETQLFVQVLNSRLKSLPATPKDSPFIEPADVGAKLDELLTVLKKRAEPEAATIATTLNMFLDGLSSRPTEEQVQVLSRFHQQLVRQLDQRFATMRMAAASEPVGPADLPAGWRSRMTTPTGWRVRIVPQRNADLAQFSADLLAIAPQAIGPAIEQGRAGRDQFHNGVRSVATTASVLIVLIVFLRCGLAVGLVGLAAPFAVIWGATRLAGLDESTLWRPEWVCPFAAGLQLLVAAVLSPKRLGVIVADLLPMAGGLGLLLLAGRQWIDPTAPEFLAATPVILLFGAILGTLGRPADWTSISLPRIGFAPAPMLATVLTMLIAGGLLWSGRLLPAMEAAILFWGLAATALFELLCRIGAASWSVPVMEAGERPAAALSSAAV
jgi:hypothetical protein